MAKAEYTLRGDFDTVLQALDDAVTGGSVTATLEEKSDFRGQDGCRCSVRVYERYSWTGQNRVSLSLTLVKLGSALCLSAITSGGSQAMFFKVNTWGEEAFLDTIRSTARRFQ